MSAEPSQKERILARLQRGPVTTAELVEMKILRYGARIHELRNEGHDIRWAAVKGRPGLTRYYIQENQ